MPVMVLSGGNKWTKILPFLSINGILIRGVAYKQNNNPPTRGK